ncbi:S8 family serine peptidase [Plantactinospora sp. B5E13]|uniref:S8 family peptidase n=1 Tax=unclassified Plantactinospora TaxID=2631981 RepID=UPI00325C654B
MVRTLRLAVTAGVVTLLGTVGTPTVGAAAVPEGRIVAVPGAEVVPDSYIVVLRVTTTTAGATAVNGKAKALAGRHDAVVRTTFSHALRGFSATMSARQARRLAADPSVAYVQPNVVHRISATQSNPPSYGLDRIDQRNLPLSSTYAYDRTASNVRAYVIDTGIRTGHADFGGRASSGFDAVDGGTADDCNGHGTHVAGTVGGSAYGVAKAVRLIAVRVLDCAGSGTTEQVVAGIDWVTRNAVKPAVANMSLGGGVDPALDDAVRRSIASGVSYSIAAGNGLLGLIPLDACTQSPARVAEAMTVSATDRTDRKPLWANHGRCVDVFAPGIDISSAWNTADGATNTISGTSMAAPHVAGAAALYLSAHPGASPAQVHAAIVDSATTGAVGGPGLGSPNRLLYTGDL